ncbi:MAG: metal ABC transporter permease [Actinomycetota bacterium]
MDRLFDFSDYDLLIPLVQNSLIAGALLGLMGGLIGIFVLIRDSSFAVHGISELSFAGAAIALLMGANVVFGAAVGSIVAALIIALLGARASSRNSMIAVLMPFGLGIGILALALYEGRAANKFGLLTGQIIAVDDPQVITLGIIAVVVSSGLLFMWRPLRFASVDSEVAEARAVPTRWLGIAFMLLLALAVAATVQIVGALLVMTLLVTPAASALRLTNSPIWAPVISVGFAVVSVLGGILLALGGGLPISPYVTTISFLIYLLARLIEKLRSGVPA